MPSCFHCGAEFLIHETTENGLNQRCVECNSLVAVFCPTCHKVLGVNELSFKDAGVGFVDAKCPKCKYLLVINMSRKKVENKLEEK